MRRPAQLIAALTGAALTGVSLLGCGAPSKTTETTPQPTPPSCTEESVPVTLDPQDPTVFHVAGWLCRPTQDGPRGHTVQLLVSGITYSHAYWDSSYEPDTYSYVRAANARGYATFAIDRLGIGRSDHPPADRLTLRSHAYAVSQLVNGLRTGAIGGTGYTTVVGVGHSFGSGVLQYLAATATGPALAPDALLLTGYLTKANPDTVAQIGNALYPAAEDPAFAAAGLPAGYLTTRPGTRSLFVGQDGSLVDPAMVALDESEKATTTLAERTSVGAARDPLVTRSITVPILLMVGGRDLLACADLPGLSCADGAAVVDRERANFVTACLDAYVLPGASHSLTTQRNAADAYGRGNDWLDALTLGGNRPAGLAACR